MEFITEMTLTSQIIIGVILLMAVYFHLLAYNMNTVNSAPALLTSIGIFGTFVGIAQGLQEFDTNQIQDSVPSLLEGLKTAFWTSIAGLFAALSIKFRYVVVTQPRQKTGRTNTVTLADLHQEMVNLTSTFKDKYEDGNAQIGHMESSVVQSISGLETSLSNYQTHMANANADALVEAIGTVMREFNVRINEQYGDNFKKLNEAVGQMLNWQKAYQDQLSTLIEQQQTTASTMTEATQAYQVVVEKTQVFGRTAEALGVMLDSLEAQSKQLDKYLKGLDSAIGEAVHGLPTLEHRMLSLTENLVNSIEKSQTDYQSLVQNAVNQMNQQLSDAQTSFSGKLLEEQDGIHQAVQKMIDRTDRQVLKLDQAMEEELTRALETFGCQLTALSEKFVRDYTPLTEKLRDVIRIADQQRKAS
ncbi:MotA/TolQ/ExbB proton channel family protein [Litoribrevibacter albus]|uniref:MotA/TolQ/ExbB proton channel domain-containing protein n=1 Tax=Litoribrevibacter albus TaxID=1473156 RepID=A0AA37W7A8_9GAMM|nr:MotA/TolQ/ExbB proton channel family protein [Litoribrevibacter albus]GLQ31123.1 hypothetical protein GCM10007876_16020 [Litoribrevibacter albus]